MSVDMVCERKDGICNLCGADPHEDCPLIGLAPELLEWMESGKETAVIDPSLQILSDNDECESCQ